MPGLLERFIWARTVESPFAAVKRFHARERRREEAIKVLDEAGQNLRVNPNMVTHLQELEAGRALDGYDREIGKGVGIRRKVTFLGRVTPIPWTQARRPLPPGGRLVAERV